MITLAENLTDTILDTKAVQPVVRRFKLTATTNEKIIRATSIRELEQVYSEALENGCIALLEGKRKFLQGREALRALY